MLSLLDDAASSISSATRCRREPTSGLEPLTPAHYEGSVTCYGACTRMLSRISKPFALLWLAQCCTVLRSWWCQKVTDDQGEEVPKGARLPVRRFLCRPDAARLEGLPNRRSKVRRETVTSV